MTWWRADGRQTRIDAVYALVALFGGWVLFGLGVFGDWHYWAPSPWWIGWRFAPLAAGALSVFLRRGAPVVSFALGTAAFAADVWLGLSGALFLIFQDNLFAVVLYGPRRAHWWINGAALALAAGLGVYTGVADGDVRTGIIVALIVIGLASTPVLTGLITRVHRQRADEARVHAEQVARLAELDRRRAVAAERTRMARELHDLVANRFSAIAVQSAALLSRDDLDDATRRGVLGAIRDGSVKGLAELRGMIELLRAPDDEAADAPVSHRLGEADLLVAHHRELGRDVSLRVEGVPFEPSSAVGLAGYRIVQESLANAAKYGDGAAAVRIAYTAGEVEITVDNRCGPTPPERPVGVNAGAGLVGMRERAQLLGGGFGAGPSGPGAWRVRAVLPAGEEAV